MVTEIRCSGLHRPMNCLGYLNLKELVEQEANQAAADGTAIGELLSEMIRQKSDSPNIGKVATNGTFLDVDMWYYARDTYRTLLETSKGNEITTEERIDWMTDAGIKIRGSYDISYQVGNTLHIEDLKFGYGIVDVKNNWQLLGYAIGKMIQLARVGIYPEKIHFKIHQPRPYHEDGPIRSWIVSTEDLLVFQQQINTRMQQLVNGDRTLSTSKSCKYCEGVNSGCSAFSRSFYKSVDTVLTDWKQEQLTNEDVSKELDLLSRVNEIVKIKTDSLKQLATMRLNNGQIIPGYSFEMKYGDRKWKDGVTVESIKTLTGLDLTSTSVMSPNQAEKAGLNKKLTSHLTVRAAKGTDLIKKDTLAEAKKILNKPKEL